MQRLITKQIISEAPLTKKDIPWLAGAIIFGGVLAPIVSMLSLQRTPASTASLLLNFEGVATTLIALIVFKENIGKRAGIAVALITLSSVILSWDFSSNWGISIGALGIILACIFWGMDNNFTRNISSKNPFTIVSIKGLGAGLFSLCLALIIGNPLPQVKIALLAMGLGFISYGLSIVLFVFAMRELGSARTSAFFGAAPFIGAFISFIVFGNLPDIMYAVSLLIMISGAIMLLKDQHEHWHLHEPITHEHKHTSDDGHHNHAHEEIHKDKNISHSHKHEHESIEHSHHHMPDINHRHSHKKR